MRSRGASLETLYRRMGFRGRKGRRARHRIIAFYKKNPWQYVMRVDSAHALLFAACYVDKLGEVPRSPAHD